MISAVVNAASYFSLSPDTVMKLGLVAAVGLVLVLGAKTILRPERDRNQRLKQLDKGLNVAIVPLLLIFLVLVVYKIFSLV